MTTETAALPTFFISHGAGPCFFLDWGPTYPWVRMDAWLRSLSNEVGVTPKAIVVISSELPAVLRLSHRIAVMCEGRLTGILPARASQEEIMRLATLRPSAVLTSDRETVH